MTSLQDATVYASDQLAQGKISIDQANVLIVQMAGIRVIWNRLPAQVRKALNAAVKAGELGHIKADGMKPEIYHHRNARARAIDEQNRIAREGIEAIKKVCI